LVFNGWMGHPFHQRESAVPQWECEVNTAPGCRKTWHLKRHMLNVNCVRMMWHDQQVVFDYAHWFAHMLVHKTQHVSTHCCSIQHTASNEGIILHLYTVQCIGVKCSTGGNAQIRPPFDHHLCRKPETFGHSMCCKCDSIKHRVCPVQP
jgi:hypothetical protein